ncbi:branched-chain amino acid transport system II carrier protein [Myroides marinus]|uniref:Branched-chain amino acid:cation transporter, LIVCS family n=1 Tax=Myroides marinus TaxID=703342 RepID=A0A1H6WCT2_9FLAO|nr:branched-chain amino acid transport system II carrier protein [Myroides marinus]KUF42102.1 branched-chain amino acid ABC transporter substrate-binding protein [Myroides marinus]MDM1348081.1 branched-chain amino acid transport system II carrier protein [Myroides marinus]MDM1351641.1 branched-chain amino acid transport system II carrier protein [Myroides marinus]MDM1355235.1 branched-chain amino acid transport system II carrier protein [Myroides marinus]MDM1358848.1 branched-chain amino acid 
MSKKSIFDAITIGFALFAMFFGAGNIILPPIIGLFTEGSWTSAVSGFSITAILAPFLGIVAVLISGDEFTDLGKRINSTLGWVLATAIILSIGPFVAIPRTAATTYEIGVLAIWPDFSATISSIVFFGITLVLSISPSRVVDIIGKYLTPLLLVLLVTMVVIGIANPIDTSGLVNTTYKDPFRLGFSEGYQTMDVLASVIYAGIIISAVKAAGYVSLKEKTKVTYMAGGVAISCLLFIYGGLVYLGATSGYEMTDNIKRTDLLLHISHGLLGSYGTIALSLCIALACLTTAIALVCATGTFFSQLTKGKLGYKTIVIITCISSGILAVKGVDNIIDYAAPFLGIIYPITLTLIIYMVAFGKRVKRRAPFVAAIATTTIIALIQFSSFISFKYDFISYSESSASFIKSLPLNDYDVPWLIPSALAFFIVYLFDKLFFKQQVVID